ncbi:MAG: hypothetical protein IJT83_09870 [Victivallales bacterium]|nr:hypothetical protein [Victivallales bacterium]
MQRNDVYKCEDCGLVIDVAVGCDCPLTCCGKEMKKLEPQTAEYKFEKHVPYPEANGSGMKVLVGKEQAHPMTEQHYIVWIEVINGDYVNRKYLKPGEKPEAEFYVSLQKGMIVREYCNIHGLWEYVVE